MKKSWILLLAILVLLAVGIHIFYPTTKKADPAGILTSNTGALPVTDHVRQMTFEPSNPEGEYLIKGDGGTLFIHSSHGVKDIVREWEDVSLPPNCDFSWTPDEDSKDTHHLAIIEEKDGKILSYCIYEITKKDAYFAELVKSVKVNFPMKYKNTSFLKDIQKCMNK